MATHKIIVALRSYTLHFFSRRSTPHVVRWVCLCAFMCAPGQCCNAMHQLEQVCCMFSRVTCIEVFLSWFQTWCLFVVGCVIKRSWQICILVFNVCNTSVYIWFNVVNNFDFMLNILALPTPLRFVCVYMFCASTQPDAPKGRQLWNCKLPPCRGGQVLQLRQHQDFQGGEVLVRIVSLSFHGWDFFPRKSFFWLFLWEGG